MNKKLCTNMLLFAFCCFAGIFMSKGIVHADVIWEPDNDFYEQNRDQCTIVDRDYTVNSSTGYVSAYKDPTSTVVAANHKNGEQLRIGFTYLDNNNVLWGAIEEGYYEDCTWIPMTDLKLVYDNQEFCKEHSDEFAEYDNRLKDKTEKQTVILWKYPNSGIVSYKLTISLSSLYYSYLYTDEAGNVWTYVPYFQCQKGWVCINNPGSEEITAPAPETSEPAVTASTNGISCAYKTTDKWSGGFIGQVNITNNSDKAINGWKLSFNCKYSILSLWNGTLMEQKDGKILVKNPDWDMVIKSGETKSVNFNASGDIEEEPDNFVVED